MSTSIICLDAETFYDQDYTLSKLTTEQYIRDPRFEVIGVSVKVDNGPTEWASGTHEELREYLKKFDWENAALLAHNTLFDGAILAWHFDIHPKFLLDTLSMSRAIHGVDVGGSLAHLVKLYQLGTKGDEIVKAKGKRRLDFTDEELSLYGDYCINDVELTYKLFQQLAPQFPAKEFKLIDLTLRMFTQPVLELDEPLLRSHLKNVVDGKAKLLAKLEQEFEGQDLKSLLMSNPKFAEVLTSFGVDPPKKISARTNKETFAFAKSDEAFTDLLEHEDERVQAVVSARLGVKSTIEETRTQTFLEVAGRGTLPVPLKYCGAHTSRWSGVDYNLQNLRSRGGVPMLKRCLMAPDGYVIVDADSSQIEARVLAWIAGQTDLVEGFRNGVDVYRIMAGRIFNKRPEDVTDEERFIGKTAILAAGYGCGWSNFQNQMRRFKNPITDELARLTIQIYRESNPKITALWRQAQAAIVCMYQQEPAVLGAIPGLIEVLHRDNAIRMPSGLTIKYPHLRATEGEKGVEFSYVGRRGAVKIYGGKNVENICQAVARCVIGEQMLKIAKRYKVVMTVHDSVVCCVREDEQEEACQYISDAMKWTPSWAQGLPVSCEVKVGPNYGDTVKWKRKEQ